VSRPCRRVYDGFETVTQINKVYEKSRNKMYPYMNLAVFHASFLRKHNLICVRRICIILEEAIKDGQILLFILN
jgi:hypothetical protein